MKTKSYLLATAALASFALSGALHAQLYWDTNGATAGSGNTGGTWDTGTNWSTDATGATATVGWTNGNSVVFSAGTDGLAPRTVTLAGTVATPSILLEEVGLVTLSGGGIDITGGATFNTSALGAVAGRSLAWNPVISGTGNLTLAVNGDTSPSGGGSNSIFSLTGANTFTGDVTITSGVVGWNSELGNAANKVILNGGGLVFNGSGTFSRNIETGASTGIIRAYGSATATFNGVISGAGTLAQTDTGTVVFAGADISGLTGTWTLNGGTTRFEVAPALTTYNLAGGNLVFAATPAAATLNWTGGNLVVGNNGTAGSASVFAPVTIPGSFRLAVRRTDAGLSLASVLPTSITFSTADSTFEYNPNSAAASANLNLDLGSATTLGILRVGGGTLTLPSGTDVVVSTVQFGSTSATNLGTLVIGPGSTVTSRYFNIGDGGTNSAVIQQTGGDVVLAAGGNGFRLGHWANNTNPGSLYNLSGGTLDATALSANAGSARIINIGWDGSGAMTVGGGAGAATLKAFGIQLDANGAHAGDETLTISANGVVEIGSGNINAGAAGDRILLNGGTLRATAAASVNAIMEALPATTSSLDGNGFDLTLTTNVTGSGQIASVGTTGGILFSTTGSQTISAGLAGTGVFSKVGTGTTTVTGSGTHSGDLNVNAGTLVFSGSSASQVNVADTTFFGGEGTIGALDLGAFGGATLRVNPVTPGALTVTGPVNLTGANTLVLTAVPPVGSPFTVFTHGGLTGTLGTDLVLPDAASYRAATFSNLGGVVSLDLAAKNLTWTGSVDGTWATGGSTNWSDGAADAFRWADRVTFDDTSSVAAIALNGLLQPGTTTFSGNTTNYTITASAGNQLTGLGSLAKTGTSVLTMIGANAYTGGTLLSKGETRVRTAGALGTGTITVGDATTGSDNVSLYLDTSRVNFGTPIVVSSAHTGTGTVTLGSRSNVGGSGDDNQFTNITLQRDVVFDSNAADRTDYENITGTGNIRVTGTGRTNFVTTPATWTGNLTVATTGAGNLQIGVASGAGNRIPDATNVTVESGAVMRMSTASETIAALLGAGTVSTNQPSGGTAILVVGSGNASGTFSGTLAGSTANNILALTKIGTGTQVLSGTANTYSGLTTLSGGVLAIASDASLGAAPTGALRRVLITAGGTGYTVAPSVTITPAPGAAGAGATATSTVTTGAVTGVTLTAAGTGFTSIPTVAFGTPGSGAIAQAELLGQVTMSGGTLRTDAAITSARSFQINTGGGGIDTNGFDSSISGGFAGSAAFTKSGAGKLTLTGVSSYTGVITVTGGTLSFVGGGQMFRTGAFFGVGGTTYLNVNAGGTAEFDQFNYGAGTNLSELRNNFYSIVVNGGTLRWVGINAANGSSGSPANRAFTIGSAGATLEVATGGTYYKAAGTTGGENIIRGNNGGNLALAGGGYGEIRDGLGTYGTWTTGATVTKNGTGTWRLTGGNTLTGTTTVNAGTLILSGGENRLSVASPIVINDDALLDIQGTNSVRRAATDAAISIDGGTLRISNGATHGHLPNLNLANGALVDTDASAGSYNGENFLLRGNVTVTGTNASTITLKDGLALDAIRTFTVADVTASPLPDLVVNAQLENTDSAFPTAGILKSGPGTMELTVPSAYNSTTTVGEGTLLLNTTLSTSALGVNSGATLGGSGSTTAPVTVAGTIAPGNSAGPLGTGSLILTGTYACEIDGPSVDRINSTGDLDLTGSTLAVTTLGGGATASSYIIATYTGTRTGAFATVTGLPSGYSLVYDDTAKEIRLEAAGYAAWIGGFFPGGAPSVVAPSADPDNDGIPNAVEFVLGGDPKDVANNNLLPTLELVTDPSGLPAGEYLKFTFRRTDASVTAGLVSGAETDADLAGPWTPAIDGVGGVVVQSTNDGIAAGIDEVRVFVPRGSNDELFGRLSVTVP